MRLRWFRGLGRRLCGASHNTVDSITGEKAVTEVKQDVRADRASARK